MQIEDDAEREWPAHSVPEPQLGNWQKFMHHSWQPFSRWPLKADGTSDASEVKCFEEWFSPVEPGAAMFASSVVVFDKRPPEGSWQTEAPKIEMMARQTRER